MVEFAVGFDLTAWIAPGADRADPATYWPWVDVTNDIRVKPGISIDVGRRDERSTVGPARCTLVFDNTAGDYTRTNPLGAYYGSLSKNTPLRLRITPTAAEVTDAFGDAATGGWGYADTGQPWYTYRSAGTAADFDVTAGVGRHSVQTAGSYRYTFLPTVQLEDANLKVTCTVTTPTGGAIEPANLLLRGQDDGTYLMCRLSVAPTTFAITAQVIVVNDFVETLLMSAATGLTHAGATALNVRAEAAGDTVRMRVWQGGAEPGTWVVSVIDPTINQAGWVGIRSGVAVGNTNAKPVVFSYDNVTVTGPHDLFVGEVPEWAPRWDKSVVDRTVPITAAGVLRRLAQNAPVLRSPAYQALAGYDPSRVAYWPLEEQSGATAVASPVGSPPPGMAGTVSFGGYTDSASSERMVKFGAGGLLFFSVPTYSSTGHKVLGLWAVPAGGLPADRAAMRLYCTGGSIGFIDLGITAGGALILNAYNGTPALADTTGPIGFAINGREVMISIELNQVGGDLTTRLFLQYASDGSNLLSDDTFTGLTIGRIFAIAVGQDDLTDVAFGHLGVGSSTTLAFANFIVPSGSTPPGVTGYAGEPASTRVERLCDQAGIPVVIRAGSSEPMGPQLVASALDNLRDCELADHGVLFEYGVGLGWQPRQARYVVVDGGIGAEVALALDAGAGELGEPPEPVDDDQALVNDAIVKRPGGGEERYEAVGPYAPDGPVGRYDTQVTLNIATDDRLAAHAQWIVAQGTQDDLRWPQIHLQLADRAALALRWLGSVGSAGVGARVTVANPPAGVAPDLLDLFVEGWSCRLGWRQWTVAMNCSPAAPFHVFTLDGSANTGRLDTAGSELASGITTTATSLSVATTSGPLWTTAAGDRPFDIAIGGERMTVTNLTGGSSPQTFTVTRSVNGVVKAHLAAAPVSLWQPYVLGL